MSPISSNNESQAFLGRTSGRTRTGFRPLRYRRCSGASLAASEIRELWTFRLRFVTLKPHVSDEADFERFRNFLRGADTVIAARDEAGIVHALLVLAVRDDVARRERILQWEYAFFSPEHRRAPHMYAIWWWLILHNVLAVPGWSVWCTAWAYPASFLVLRQNLPGLVHLQTPGLSDSSRDVLLRFGRHVQDGSFNETTGVREMPTIPLEGIAGGSKGSTARAWDEYVAANPNWADGFTLEVGAPVSLVSLGSIASTIARRSLRFKKLGLNLRGRKDHAPIG